MIFTQLALALAASPALAAIQIPYAAPTRIADRRLSTSNDGIPQVAFSIGTPPQEFANIWLELRNGTGVLVNPTDKCKPTASMICYTPSNSTSFTTQTGGKDDNGTIGTDSFRLSFPSGSFTTLTVPIQGDPELLPDAARLSLSPATAFWDAVSKPWADRKIGLFIGKPPELNKASSMRHSLSIQGADTSLYTGDITWFERPAAPRTGPGFAAEIQKLTVNGQEIDLNTAKLVNSSTATTSGNSQSAVKRQAQNNSTSQESNTPYLQLGLKPNIGFGRYEDAIMEAIGGTTNFLYAHVPLCDTKFTLGVTIAGKEFPINLHEYYKISQDGCQLPLSRNASRDAPENSNIIYGGLPVMSSVYTIIDLEANKVGVAQLSGQKPKEEEAPKSSATRSAGAVYLSALVATVMMGAFLA